MIPYGKDNWRRNADVARGTYLARRGYAFCRVDVRGTGSSGGVALDEYTEAETLDGYDAVEWLAAQPWCDGAVGMWGISYGAFTSIQVAKLRPPHLRAIVPVMGTDDRYLSDVHYIGGCVTVSELSQYAVSQVGMNAMPPDPAFRGDAWREEWLARLEATPPWLIEWLRQQHDGPYWRAGSLAPDYDAIEAAILNVGGWMDSYVDAALRMQAACTAPSRTIVGNWVHDLPDVATPGPNLDDLHELVRFFDRWLKGIPNGADEEPAITWFEREYAEPEPFPAAWPGRWRAATAYPHPATWRPSGGSAADRCRSSAGWRPARATRLAGVDRYPHRPTVGTRAALSWGAGGPPNGLGRDLRPDESLGPTYTSEPLETARRDPRRPGGRPPPLGLGAGRDRGRPADRRGPGRHVGPGHGRDPQPDPSPLARRIRSRSSQGASRRSAWRCAPPDIASCPATASGSRWRRRPGRSSGRRRIQATFELHHGGATPSRLVLPVIPPAGGPGDAPVPAFKTHAARRPGIRRRRRHGRAGLADHGRRHRRDRDRLGARRRRGRPRGRSPALRRRDPDDDRLRRRSGARRSSTPTSSTAGASTTSRPRSARARPRPATREAFHLTVDLEVDVDGEPFFRRAWSESIERRLV